MIGKFNLVGDGDMSERIVKNAIQCTRCKVVLESKYRHDFIMCDCKQPVGVDGGKDYLKRTGRFQHYIELSVVEDYDDRYQLENVGTVITKVHAPSKCVGRSCPVHNKSDHHMRSMPQYIQLSESFQAFMVRECTHHIFHIDPDEDDGYLKSIDIDGSVCTSKCDGCCKG